MSEHSTEETKRGVMEHLRSGRRSDAIMYLMDALSIPYEDADRLVATIEAEEQQVASVNPAAESVKKSIGGCAAILLRVIGVSFLIMAFGFFLSAGILHLTNSAIIRDSERYAGHVVEFYQDTSGYAPVIEYIKEGVSHKARSTTISKSPSYEIGEEVFVFVKEETGEAIIDSFTDRWLFPVILGGLGVFLAIFGLLFFRAARRLKKRITF